MWLVIGYGSPLHSDDRLGWAVSDRLETALDPAVAEIVTCTQLTPEWSEPISRADGVLFVDASAELPPGQIDCVELTDHALEVNAPGSIFTHHVTPQSLMDAACALYGHAPPGWLFSVGAANFDLGDMLSPEVADAIPALMELIGERIRTHARVQHC